MFEIKKIWNKLYAQVKNNHAMMMVVCCAVPLILLVIAVNVFNFNSLYLYWFVILLCPLMHILMMKDHHKHGQSKKCH